MKKYLVYIITGLVVLAVILLVFTGNNARHKAPDQRITLKRQDKIPYGSFVAFDNLHYLFPQASISVENKAPGNWDSLSTEDSQQAIFILTGQFNADEEELKKLVDFVSKGNDVFISARSVSWYTKEMLNCSMNTFDIPEFGSITKDSLHLFLNQPPYKDRKGYFYSGKVLDASFIGIDESISEVIGENKSGQPDFIRLRAGKGNLYLHLAPLAFTNHFILFRDNMEYYEKALSVIPADTKRFVWDEYYLNKRFVDQPSNKKSWFSVLMKYPAFKAALLTAMLGLLLYVFIEMRRKQRVIPVVTKPRNDSLDFVKTIGRLYFDKADHKNLSRKMSSYFLEHVRNVYKIPTSNLDEDFIKNLQYKSGATESDIRSIVSMIQETDASPDVDEKKLAELHKQLELFYKNTR